MTTIVPPSTQADARNRAVRTFLQGLALDVAAMVVVVCLPVVADVRWTRAYWVALGLLAAKTVVQTGVAYVARHLLPPQP